MWGGDVGAQAAELTRSETSRLEALERVEDPRERLQRLMALTDEMILEHAEQDGVIPAVRSGRAAGARADREGISIHAREEMESRYQALRARLMAGAETIAREIPSEREEPVVSHISRQAAAAGVERDMRETIARADVSAEEAAEMLAVLEASGALTPEEGSREEIGERSWNAERAAAAAGGPMRPIDPISPISPIRPEVAR